MSASRSPRSWLSKLRRGDVLVLDGATGTELRRRRAQLDPNAWSGRANLSDAQLLADIHADYLRAGADVVTTNTFGTTRFVLAAAGLEDRFEQINRAAVAAARGARERTGSDAFVAGSISCLPPGFDVRAYPDPQSEADAYVELATLLAEAGVDLLTLEMMEEIEHARRACEAVRRVGLPFWLGISGRLAADRRTLTAYDFPNIELASVLDALLEFGPALVNVMHTPADAVPVALAELSSRWHGFFGVYPIAERDDPGNSETEAANGRALTPERLAALAVQWVADGASVVGGCCGTTPMHVRAIASALRQIA